MHRESWHSGNSSAPAQHSTADAAGVVPAGRPVPGLHVACRGISSVVTTSRSGPDVGAWQARLDKRLPALLPCTVCSKAFGCLGGFVACSRQWKDFLVNAGRTQVFSTALPVPVAAAALAALRAAAAEPWRRQRVWRLAARLGGALGVPVTSPIVPLVIGPEQETVDISMRLLQQGFHVPAIRPPTVPAGTSRLRVSLSAAHSDADLEQLIAALRACGLQDRQLSCAAAEAAEGAGIAGAGDTLEGQAVAAAAAGEAAGPAAAGGTDATEAAAAAAAAGPISGYPPLCRL